MLPELLVPQEPSGFKIQLVQTSSSKRIQSTPVPPGAHHALAETLAAGETLQCPILGLPWGGGLSSHGVTILKESGCLSQGAHHTGQPGTRGGTGCLAKLLVAPGWVAELQGIGLAMKASTLGGKIGIGRIQGHRECQAIS